MLTEDRPIDLTQRDHYKSLAQLRNAVKLAKVCASLGIDSDAALVLSAEGKRNVERAAGTNLGRSETTWGMVSILLAG